LAPNGQFLDCATFAFSEWCEGTGVCKFCFHLLKHEIHVRNIWKLMSCPTQNITKTSPEMLLRVVICMTVRIRQNTWTQAVVKMWSVQYRSYLYVSQPLCLQDLKVPVLTNTMRWSPSWVVHRRLNTRCADFVMYLCRSEYVAWCGVALYYWIVYWKGCARKWVWLWFHVSLRYLPGRTKGDAKHFTILCGCPAENGAGHYPNGHSRMSVTIWANLLVHQFSISSRIRMFVEDFSKSSPLFPLPSQMIPVHTLTLFIWSILIYNFIYRFSTKPLLSFTYLPFMLHDPPLSYLYAPP